MEKEQIESYNILQPLLLSAAVAIGIMVGYKMNEKPESALVSTADYPQDSMHMTGRIEELIRFIEYKYVDKVDSDVLIAEAMHGVMSKLDPHSIYLSPAEIQDVNDHMNGTYSGIGIDNLVVDDTVNIRSVLPDSPALKAGLKSFDKIISINDVNVTGKEVSYNDIRQMLKQSPGTKLDLTVLRDKKEMIFHVTVDEVPVRSVTSTLITDHKTVLLKIDRFGSNTYKEFMLEIEKYFGSKKAEHLILDLRDNPGGYLPEATNILCQIFEEKEKLLLYTEGRNSKRNEYKSNGKRFFNINQVVVLIDENSASASEIIAGAIQDWDRGIVIGRRSYGKGLVQEQYQLNNGGAVRLTVARYFTPSGRSIQRAYEDRTTYDDDFFNRYKNGDLFNKDSTLIKNGGKYFTQVLRREVSGAGGITPDIFIALDSVYKDERAFEIKSMIPEFAFRYMAKHKDSMNTLTINTDALKLNGNLIPEFSVFIKSNSNEKKDYPMPFLEKFRKDIIQEIKNLSKNDVISEISESDPFISEALNAIRKNLTPATFTPKSPGKKKD